MCCQSDLLPIVSLLTKHVRVLPLVVRQNKAREVLVVATPPADFNLSNSHVLTISATLDVFRERPCLFELEAIALRLGPVDPVGEAWRWCLETNILSSHFIFRLRVRL